jgi:hypothetical protein
MPNAAGRMVGYAVEATCDLEGCEEKIDRGLAYVCGSMHDGGEYGCGDYFCPAHIFFNASDEQLCQACLDRFEEEHPEIVAEDERQWQATVDKIAAERDNSGS